MFTRTCPNISRYKVPGWVECNALARFFCESLFPEGFLLGLLLVNALFSIIPVFYFFVAIRFFDATTCIASVSRANEVIATTSIIYRVSISCCLIRKPLFHNRGISFLKYLKSNKMFNTNKRSMCYRKLNETSTLMV